MLIDCDTCTAAPSACGDCIVTHLLSTPPATAELTDSEIAAVGVLAAGGLVPPLRLVTDPQPASAAHRSRPRPRAEGPGEGWQTG